VTTIKQANEFLLSYIPIHSKTIATPFQSIPSAFETQPSEEQINLTLAILSSRVVDSGHCVSYQNQYFCFLDLNGESERLKSSLIILYRQIQHLALVLIIEAKSIFTNC